MAYADIRSGWSLPALAATVAAHCALLAVAATAFHHAAPAGKDEAEALVALFDTARPEPAPAAAPPSEQPVGELAVSAPPTPRPAVVGPPVRQTAGADRLDISETVAAPAAALPPLPARETIATPSAPAAPDTRTADALSRYAGLLRSAIAARTPRGLNREGEVLVAFRLDQSGALLGAEVARSSGQVQLDRLALRMVRQAAPFPPPEADIAEDRLAFTIPVRFH